MRRQLSGALAAMALAGALAVPAMAQQQGTVNVFAPARATATAQAAKAAATAAPANADDCPNTFVRKVLDNIAYCLDPVQPVVFAVAETHETIDGKTVSLVEFVRVGDADFTALPTLPPQKATVPALQGANVGDSLVLKAGDA